MKTTVKDGQTLADIAIQEFGTIEALPSLAQVNGLSMTAVPEAGRELTLPDGVWNRTMQNWCKNNDVSPATARDQSGVRLRIFDDEFEDPFK